jgi:hypothetical protein
MMRSYTDHMDREQTLETTSSLQLSPTRADQQMAVIMLDGFIRLVMPGFASMMTSSQVSKQMKFSRSEVVVIGIQPTCASTENLKLKPYEKVRCNMNLCLCTNDYLV